jgi:signal transduction histidine kinase/CheY-like chemotaxis protein
MTYREVLAGKRTRHMTLREIIPSAASGTPRIRLRLLQKYVGLFVVVVCAALVANGLVDIWFSFQEQRSLLVQVQREQANTAALRIGQFIHEVQGQLAWSTQLPWSSDTLDEWRFDVERLFHQVPAVTEVYQLDAAGHEQARKSRTEPDLPGPQTDFSQDPAFKEAVANKIYYGPVYFLRGSEPYMTIAMAGVRREYGVIVAQVNLAFIWEVVSDIKVGSSGQAYVVDPDGRLIAHPDISMVLRNTDMSGLRQVQAARADSTATAPDRLLVTQDVEGRRVLSAHARVDPLGWLVFVELPLDEAYASIYASIKRSAAFFLVALVLAALAGLFLAHRMIIPIRALHAGAARIGKGDLTQQIAIRTGDELEALGGQFNSMAAQLHESYATLESKVQERTHQLELANRAKSRFLAAASHDLRQPLHAIGLYIAQLQSTSSAAERQRVIERIDVAIANMNDLFKGLLDISKLDAGSLTPNVTEFPVGELLERVHVTFAATAQEAGLDLRVIPHDAWVRSDFILLERVLLNLVSNALRYTSQGGVLIGCRKSETGLRIEVWDTGPGIPKNQHENIFGEFYRLSNPQTKRSIGLGLGLAIVDRLCRLLDHTIELRSVVGRGSRFAVVVPTVAPHKRIDGFATAPDMLLDLLPGKFVVVVDDDPLALDGTAGMLRSWGCEVITGGSMEDVLNPCAKRGRLPDIIISDYSLGGDTSGIAAIDGLRNALHTSIPAFLISGDTAPELVNQIRAAGYHLLHKPVSAIRLRALMLQLLRADFQAPL